MGLGALSPVGLDHLLLLCVEGSEVHRQGETFTKLFNNETNVAQNEWQDRFTHERESGMCIKFYLTLFNPIFFDKMKQFYSDFQITHTSSLHPLTKYRTNMQ